MISAGMITKLRTAFTSLLGNATYELDGTVTPVDYSISVSGETVRIIIILDSAVTGQASNFKVYDAEGALALSSNMVFAKIPGKKQYVAFAVTFTERVT